MRRNWSSLASIAALSVLVACGKPADKPAATEAAAPVAAPAPAAAEPAPATSTMMAAADSIGVPECDTYVAKYMECVGTKVPEAARAQFKASFDAAVAAWKQTAATPEGRSGLAAACSQAQTAAAQAMTAYGCTF